MKYSRHIVILALMTAAMVALLAWSFSGVKKDEVLEAFRTAQWGYAPIAVLFGLLVFPVKALRWRVILGSERAVPFRTLLSAIMIGFMVNCIFSRVGEIVRAVILSLKGEMRTATALASIALERIFDSCTVILFLVVGLLWLHPAAAGEGAGHLAHLRIIGGLAALLLVCTVTFLVFLRMRPEAATRFVLACVNWLPERLRLRTRDFLKTFLDGLDTIRGARQLATILVLSILHWLIQVLFFLFAAWCFEGIGLTFPGALLVFALTAFGVAALPLPGYVGIYQGGILAAAAVIGVNLATAEFKSLWVSYAWLSWAIGITPVILIGFVFLWAEGLTLRDIRGKNAARP